MKNNRGSILMISLWVLAVLVIFAVGLGHRASINLRLARYQREKLKAYSLAKAGINRAIVEIINDQTVNYDSLVDNWANNDILKKISFSEDETAFATVSYLMEDIDTEKEELVYGVVDEERKININSIDETGKKQLLEIFKFKGLDNAEAEELKNTLAEWISSVKEPEEGKDIFKNEELKMTEELLLILEYFYKKKGEEDYQNKAQEIFSKVKGLITVYGDKKVNINTTSKDVLTILANAVAENQEQKDSVVKVVEAFKAPIEEGKFFTSQDDLDNFKGGFNTGGPEDTLLNNLKGLLKVKSDFFRIEASGNAGKTIKRITVIYSRLDKRNNYWHQN